MQKLIELLKANQSANRTTAAAVDYTTIAKQMIENKSGFNQGFTQGFPASENVIGAR